MGMGDIDPTALHIASTERMIQLVAERPASEFIIATETGIMHRMEQLAPEKTFLAADPEAVCAYMKTITLPRVKESLELDRYHITVPPDIAARARAAVDRMVALGAGGEPGDGAAAAGRGGRRADRAARARAAGDRMVALGAGGKPGD